MKMREINVNEERDSRSSSALLSGDSPRANPVSKSPKRKSKSSVFKPSGISNFFQLRTRCNKGEGGGKREENSLFQSAPFWNSGCQFVEDVPPASRPVQSRTHTPISIVIQHGASTTSDRTCLSPLKMCSSVVT